MDKWLLQPIVQKQGGNYGRDVSGGTLADLIDDANALADSGCNLIVAGGLVAVIAAYEVSRTPAIGLIGRKPQNSSEPGWAATQRNSVIKAIVNLDTASHNAERRDRLRQAPFNVSANGIALMVNMNSAMGDNELEDWLSGGGTAFKFPDLANKMNNDASHFVQFFKKIPAQISGIIVSSDPFFFRDRSRLISGADAARAGGSNPQFKLCFPFSEWQYKDSGTQLSAWDPQRHIGFCGTGMDLMPAYKQLGVAAEAVLSNLYPAPVFYTASQSRWVKS